MPESEQKSHAPLRKTGSILLNIALLAAVFLAVTAFQTRQMLPTDRQPAPQLTAAILQSGSYELDLSASRPVLVYFFAPWCTYCAVSSGNLVRLRRWRDESDLEIISVALDWQSVEEVRGYAERHELNMPVLLGDRQTAQDWQVYAFPTYYVLDSQHRVVRRDIGYSTQLGLWWRSWAVN